MTFATEAAKSASERFCLVKISPRKLLTGGISLGGNNYQYNIGEGYHITTIRVFPIDTNVTFTYVAGVLVATSVTNLLTNTVIMNHDLFVTGTTSRYTSGISGVDDAEWLPYLAGYPNFTQSMADIAEGVFSLSGTEISLISVDRWGQELFGANDSLSKAPITVWACINTVGTNRRIFDGEVASARYAYGKLTIEVIDTFFKLQNTASFGTKSQSQIYAGNTYTLYPDARDENKAMSLTFGRSSPMTVTFGWRHLDPYGSPNGSLYHLSEGIRAIKISPNQPTGATTIKFLCGRVIGSDVKRLNFGTISSAYAFYVQRQVQEVPGRPSPLLIYDKILYLEVDTFNGEIGDYIPTVGGWVCGYEAGLWGAYNLAICCPDYGLSELNNGNIPNPSGPVAVPSIPNNTIPSVSCWIDGGNGVQYKAYYYSLSLLPSSVSKSADTRYLKFTVSTDTYTFNGQDITLVYAEISPVTNGLNVLDQSNSLLSATINCRISPAAPMTHANALKYIVSSAAMDINSASFTQADIDLSANVSMTLPLSEGSDFETYLSAAQLIAKSTMGLLRVNTSREVEYEIIKNLAAMSIDANRSTVNMLSDSTYSTIQYQDIYSAVSFENGQLQDLTALAGTGPKAFVESITAKNLHKIDRIKNVTHCLDSIQNRKSVIAGYFAAPTVEYQLTTASEDLSSAIGDVVEITNTAVGNDAGVAKALIVGIDQRASDTTIKLNEIRGVT